MQFIFLIGPPGSGKTVCGQALASLLDCPFFDTDRLIESQQSSTVSELFASRGESHFRQLELDLLESLNDRFAKEQTVVFATGGGLPVFNNNIERLQKLGKVIALSASLPVLTQRVQQNSNRPLLAAASQDGDKQLQQRLFELINTRAPVYEQAGYKIDTSGLKPEEVAHEIIQMVFNRDN